MLGSIAEGETRITGLLEGSDVLSTIGALRQMGVRIEGPRQGSVRIAGVGMRGLQEPRAPLDMGNSGTAMRLMCGLLAGQKFDATLVGDASLSRRPMRRVADPLGLMGARISTRGDGTPPLNISATAQLEGLDYVLPVPSAQVKSALLLAGLYARGKTCVEEPVPTRDHTERMLGGFGYPVERTGNKVCVQGGGALAAMRIDVPADISSAAFFLVAALIAEGSELRLEHVGVNPTRTGVLDVLQRMGGRIEARNRREICGEPVADIVVRASKLSGIDIPEEFVPRAIDEFPVICVAAACASGTTVVRGARELRYKESDRISAMVSALTRLGVRAEELEDGLRITGGQISGGRVDGVGDHRVAMALCVAGLCASSSVEVTGCDNVATSFPDFPAAARRAGMRIDEA